MKANHQIPTGGAHLAMLMAVGEKTRSEGIATGAKYRADTTLLGTSMCALYQAATCHRKCWDGGHVLESLSGRVYNLSGAAFDLTLAGYYDEALALTRSIGEIANLIQLSVIDKSAINKWLNSDKKTRVREFSPLKIRLLLEQNGEQPFIADEGWYSALCEQYVHASPSVRPNMHNAERPLIGGVFQEQGLEKSLAELCAIVTAVALLVCRYFQLDDLFDDISSSIAALQTA